MLFFTIVLVHILCGAATGANLRCYACNNNNETATCNTVEQCNDPSEVCYLESTSENGKRIYNQGCISPTICGDTPGGLVGRGLHRRQEGQYEFKCCTTDRCNKRQATYGLVFRITTHNGGDVADAWANGTKTVSDENCRNVRTNGCVVHYRNDVIDNWAKLNIAVIKYALYVDGKEVAYIFFNGTGSTKMNWFSQNRIINSTWIDLKTAPTNSFGIDAGFPANRRFYINKDWGGCDNDHGWTVVVTGHHVCNFDNRNGPYPYILYAKGNTVGHYFETQTIGEADVAAVYIYQN